MKFAALKWICGAGVCAILAAGTGVVVEDYQAATIFGRTTSGLHDPTDVYTYPNEMVCVADLVPVTVSEVAGAAGNYFTVVDAAFPAGSGWTFQNAVNPLGAGAIEVHTYDVQGTQNRVGAEIHVEYAPGAGDPTTNIHWIQVVTNNHKIGAGGGHAVPDNKVDLRTGVATTPYYDDGFAADATDFYDFPGRVDARRNHNWDAVTFLVQGPAVGAGPGLVTFLGPGFSWGWKNTCDEKPKNKRYFCSPKAQVTFAASGTIQPGASLQFSPLLPASIDLTKDTTNAAVDLTAATISLDIDTDVDEGGISTLVVTGGGGQFAAYLFGKDVIGSSTFVVKEGIGSIHWEANEIYVQMKLIVSSPGFPNIEAFATGTGVIDTETDQITMDADALGVELIAIRIPAVSQWGVAIMIVLLFTAGTILVGRRRRSAAA